MTGWDRVAGGASRVPTYDPRRSAGEARTLAVCPDCWGDAADHLTGHNVGLRACPGTIKCEWCDSYP